MTANQLSVVTEVFNQANIRIVMSGEEPAFCLADICKAIGMRDDSARRSLDLSDDFSGTQIESHSNKLVFDVADSRGLVRPTRFIDEEQAYQLIMVGRSELCKEFRKFASKIIKSLRQEGIVDLRPAKSPHEMVLESIKFLMGELEKEKSAKELALTTIEKQAPLVNFANVVQASEDWINVGTFAKILAGKGIDTGAHRFYQWLRDHEYVCKAGKSKNLPTQKAIELGVLAIQETVRPNSDPELEPHIDQTTMVTPKGQVYFANRLTPKN